MDLPATTGPVNSLQEPAGSSPETTPQSAELQTPHRNRRTAAPKRATTGQQPRASSKGRRRAVAKSAQVIVPTRSWAEHYAAGKALRATCPREAHAALARAVRKGTVKAVFEEER